MTLDPDKLLDSTGWQILLELEANARLSFAELGRRVGLSLPAVAERLRRMEDAGIITGYRVPLDPANGLDRALFICPQRIGPGWRSIGCGRPALREWGVRPRGRSLIRP